MVVYFYRVYRPIADVDSGHLHSKCSTNMLGACRTWIAGRSFSDLCVDASDTIHHHCCPLVCLDNKMVYIIICRKTQKHHFMVNMVK
jgi:hypothetical protein